MDKTTDIGDGIGVVWRRITYQSMAKIHEVYESAMARAAEKAQGGTAKIAKVWEAEQELIALLCKSVTFTDDNGAVVTVDLTTDPERMRELPFNTMKLLMESKESPLVLSAKQSP